MEESKGGSQRACRCRVTLWAIRTNAGPLQTGELIWWPGTELNVFMDLESAILLIIKVLEVQEVLEVQIDNTETIRWSGGSF